MTEKKPSDVFLELWQWRALDMSLEQFAECAGVWREIVHLEELYAAAQRQQHMQAMLDAIGAGPLIAQGPLVPAEKARTESDTEPGAVTYDCASATMPDPAPEEVEKCAEEAVEADPDAKYTGYMSRLKNETRERLLRLRKEKGLTVNDILAADTYGLRWSDIMDMIEAKPVPLPRWEALAKILDQYEEAQAGG